MVALSASMSLVLVAIIASLGLAGVSLELSCLIVGAFVYMCLSLLFNPRWNVFNHPFSPIVILKPFCYVSIFVNIASNGEYFQKGTDGAVIAVVGFIFLVGADAAGMLFKRSVIDNNRSAQVSNNAGLVVSLFAVMFVLGWIWRLYALTHGLLYGTHLGTRLEVTSYSNLLGSLSYVSTIAFWGLFVNAKRARLMLVLAVLEIIWFAVSGSKSSIVSVALSAMFVEFWRGRFRVTNRNVLISLSIALVFVISFSLIYLYRKEAQRVIISSGYGAFSAVTAAKSIQFEEIDLFSLFPAVGDRLNLAWSFSLLYNSINEGTCRLWYGESFIRMFTWFVPRAVWPDKPQLSMGRWFAENYLGWGLDSRAEGQISIWGEGYLNFGILGAITLPLLWIAIIQWVYLFAVRRGRWGVIFYASTYAAIVNSLSANVASPLATMSQMVLIILLLKCMVRLLIESTSLIKFIGRRNGNLGFHRA